MAGLIVVLALYMGATAATGLGITTPRSAVDLDGYAVAQEVDGEQYVETALDYGSFGDIAVKQACLCVSSSTSTRGILPAATRRWSAATSVSTAIWYPAATSSSSCQAKRVRSRTAAGWA